MIRIHYSLIVFSIILCYLGLKELFLVVVISNIAHELMHILIGIIFHLNVKYVSFSLIGGTAFYNNVNLSFRSKIIFYLGGIFGNLIIILFLLPLKDLPFVIVGIFYNLLMILINCLWINPLDGYNVLKEILLEIFDYEYTNILMGRFAIISYLILLIIASLFNFPFVYLLIIYLCLKNLKNKDNDFYVSFLSNLRILN